MKIEDFAREMMSIIAVSHRLKGLSGLRRFEAEEFITQARARLMRQPDYWEKFFLFSAQASNGQWSCR